MTIDTATFFAVATPVLGGVIWLIRLEGRVNVGDQRFEDIVNRLKRIEYKIDDSTPER